MKQNIVHINDKYGDYTIVCLPYKIKNISFVDKVNLTKYVN